MRKIMNIKALAKSLALGGLLCASVAGAATYTWSGGAGNLGAGGTGGHSAAIQHMTFTYNENTQDLSVTARWSTTGSTGAPDGAWLVLTDGAMPKASPYEVPIYYLDWKSGTNRIVAQGYDGTVADGGNPWFGSWENRISVTNGTGYQQISYTLNLAGINAYDPNGSVAGQGDWKGGDFANNVGVWFHWFDQDATNKVTYTAQGSGYKINHVGYTTESYYDTGGCGNATTITGTPTGGQAGNDAGGVNCNAYGPGSGGGGSVPAPGIVLMLGLGLAVLGAKRRK
jgi:hypothetical protein